MKTYRTKKGKGKEKDDNAEVVETGKEDASSALKKKKKKKPSPPKKTKAQPFSDGEHARLFHTIFDFTDEARATLDLLLTGMSRHQLDANDPKLKNPWMDIAERYNDPENDWENLFPDDENCGEDIIDPSHLLENEEPRDWIKLKELWNKIRAAITTMLVQYNKR